MRLVDVVVAGISLVVVALVAGYVAAPTTQRLVVRIRAESAGDAVSAGGVVYGQVHDTDGSGLRGVTVTVARPTKGPSDPEATTSTASDGTYRLEMSPGDHRVTFSCTCHGHALSGSADVVVHPGRAYRIDAEVRDETAFFVAPVSSY